MIIQFALESLGVINEDGQFENINSGEKWSDAPN
jgi:hypothetical protein